MKIIHTTLRYNVKIDRSQKKLNQYTEDKQPKWSEETLFLKELVSGKGSLWQYMDNIRSWYFYSIDSSVPEQLVYKQFLVTYDTQNPVLLNSQNTNTNYTGNQVLFENAAFRQQLAAYIENEFTKDIDVQRLKYDENELIHYFRLYNNINEKIARKNKPDREILNFKASASLSYSSMSVQNGATDSKPFVLDNKFNWMAGLEFEYFLPFNRNTWSVILTPTYEQIYNTKTVDFKLGNIIVTSDKRTFDIISIDLPVGIRYTNYLQNNSKYFLNILINSPINVSFKKYFQYNTYGELNPNEGINVILGAGYSISNLSFELKYHSSRELLNQYGSWKTNYPKISISASYKIFKIIGK